MILSDIIETKTMNSWLQEDGIIHSEIKKNSIIRIPEFIENFDIQFQEEIIKRPVLMDISELIYIDKESRKYAAEHIPNTITAFALLAQSDLSKAIANMYIKFDKPPIPTKIFYSEEEAIDWLKQFV